MGNHYPAFRPGKQNRHRYSWSLETMAFAPVFLMLELILD
jgi:hypothetical protein